MSFNLDSKMKDLFDSEELTYIEFSEYPSHDNKKNQYDHTMSQDGGEGSDVNDIEYLFTPDGRSYQHSEIFEQDGGAGSDMDDPADIDYLFQTEARHQEGGAVEKDFLSVFNAANEYSKRIKNLATEKKSADMFIENSPDDQMGGKRELNPSIRGMLEITASLRKREDYIKKELEARLRREEEIKGKTPNMQGVLMKISGFIWRDAEKQVGSGASPSAILKKALDLSSNLKKYLEDYKASEIKPKKEKKPKKKKD
jgi:hypothetical protein